MSFVGKTDERPLPVLEIKNLSKTFPGTIALDAIAIQLRPGSVHAVVGMNGSGKSTLVKVLSGFYEPDPGVEVFVAGQHSTDFFTTGSPGLRFVHQDLALQESMSVAENLAVVRGYAQLRFGLINWRQELATAQEAMRQVGFGSIDVRTPVSALSQSEKAAVAIARALAPGRGEIQCVAFDEPTAAMPAPEAQRVLALVRSVRDKGIAVLYISHHLDEVMDVANEVTVLRDGRVVHHGPTEELSHESLVQHMIGRELLEHQRAEPVSPATETALIAENLSGAGVDSINFDVRRGEVLGLAGIPGSGRDDVCSLLVGAIPRTGTVHVLGKSVPSDRPDLAVLSGMAFVPANRRQAALLPTMAVRENLTVGYLRPVTRRHFLNSRAEQAETRVWMHDFHIAAPSIEAPISLLSGGNQQKVILARAMRRSPEVLLLDEPTQGIDVGAKKQIYDLIRKASERGIAVIVASSDSEDLAEMCTRILVLSQGAVVETISGAAIDQKYIDHAAVRPRRHVTSRGAHD
jgi:ribose transport system ATP-binding protein